MTQPKTLIERRVDHLTAFLAHLVTPGDVIEVRGLGFGRSESALFSNMSIAARYCVWLNDQGWNVFYTPNPLDPRSEVVRRHHPLNYPRLRSWKSARDTDVLRQSVLPIDIDPVRPAGVPASDSELAEAKSVAEAVTEHLNSLGWPEPIRVISGNGIHLLFRAEHVATVDPVWWKQCLRALSRRFETPAVKIDQAVWNLSRILRAPATVNRKGDHTSERPHRLARVVSYPSDPEVVREKLVRALAMSDEGNYASSSSTYAQRELLIDEDGLRDLIDSYPEVLSISKERTTSTQTMLGLAECPFVERGHRGQNVGVSKTVILIDPTKNKIGFNCLSDECAEHTFGDLRKLLEERTGRPTPQIFADEEFDFEELLSRWGCDYDEDDDTPLTDEQICERLGLVTD
jgi:hypothetical protein